MLSLLANLLLLPATADEGPAPDPIASEHQAPDRDRHTPRVRGENGLHLLPLRLDTRAAIREGMGTGLLVELGVQLARTRSLLLDANVAYVSPRAILVPGPARNFFAWEFGADALVPVTRWMAVGPSGGVAFRLFRQQGSAIDEAWVPFAGVRTHTTLLSARKGSLAVGLRVTVDLAVTRFVMEDSRVVGLSPVEGQLGLRMNFGHGPQPKARPAEEG